jgi:hypothetical protein
MRSVSITQVPPCKIARARFLKIMDFILIPNPAVQQVQTFSELAAKPALSGSIFTIHSERKLPSLKME